jgi:hypothetical protein
MLTGTPEVGERERCRNTYLHVRSSGQKRVAHGAKKDADDEKCRVYFFFFWGGGVKF